MGVKFTEEQNRAIETLDKSILVSAAAGSGKTAVLVQRIINIILSGKADVDEMLVVTFTKAAADEMRLKLARAIKKRMKEDPDNRAKLREQLNKLYRSYISTFDSFAVRVIREFFYETDIEPDFRACDEVQSELLKNEALDALLEEAFVCDELIAGASFRSFLRLYSEERSENAFKDNLLSAYAKLRSMPDYWDWAYASVEKLRVDRNDLGSSEFCKYIMEDAAQELEIAWKAVNEVKSLYADNGIEHKFYQMLGSEFSLIEELRRKAIGGILDDAFIESVQNIEWINLSSYTQFFEKKVEDDLKKIYAGFKKEITPWRNIYKKSIANIVNRYFLPDLDTRISEMNATYEYTLYYLNLMKAFEDRYVALKKDSSLLDFADMEHIAFQILKKSVPAETLRKRFKYIFIDEYQDTNNIQEQLIRRFAREANVFKVGDIKQSIYRFRQAEPAIFEKVYRDYSEETNSDAITIDLNKNFRSNDATIRYINAVFRDIMDGYDDAASLYTGLCRQPGYQDEYDFVPEVHLLCKETINDEDVSEQGSDASAADEEIENLNAEEAEAKYIAELVRDTIGTEFCDTKTGEIRQATARDIAILFRATKVRGELMSRALRNVAVQAHIEDDDNYFDTLEISIALSLFTCIDNMKRDVPLIATLHSEVFAWTPDELAIIRIEHRKRVVENDQSYRRPPYWEAVKWYADNGADGELKNKVRYAVECIEEWRKLSNMMSTADFIWKVLVDSGYYLRVGAMYDGNRRQANLRVLVDRARQYCEGNVASLSSFLRFIEVMKTKNISNGQASMVSKDDDVVRITTIHKSKGLEYPFVIVGGLGHKFRMDNNDKKLSFDSEIGVALHYVSPDRRYWRSTVIQRAINSRSNTESYKEELRVLYVAMTRARNKLFLVGTVKNEEELDKFSAHPNCFLKVMRNVLDTPYNEYHVCHLDNSDNTAAASRFKELLNSRSRIKSNEALMLYDEINRRLSYEYPDQELLTAKAKYSVSALRHEELSAQSSVDVGEDSGVNAPADNEVVSLWHITDSKKKASAADIGIAYHRIMEYISFAKVGISVDKDYIRESANYLHDNGAIDDEVFKSLDYNKIAAFFSSDLGKRAIAADNAATLRKEKPFTLKTEWQGRDILVQGVIDCCWPESDPVSGEPYIVLIDYKTSFINPRKNHGEEIERIRNEYRTQIDLYSQAVEEGTGIAVKEAYLYLFETSEAIAMK